MKIFIYGTLRHPEVYKIVTGVNLDVICKSYLYGYDAFYIERESYPGIIKTKGSRLEGDLIEVSDKYVDRVKFFEEDYILVPVEVVIEKDQKENCFVFMPGANLIVSSDHWSYDKWISKDISNYLEESKKFISQFPETF